MEENSVKETFTKLIQKYPEYNTKYYRNKVRQLKKQYGIKSYIIIETVINRINILREVHHKKRISKKMLLRCIEFANKTVKMRQVYIMAGVLAACMPTMSAVMLRKRKEQREGRV